MLLHYLRHLFIFNSGYFYETLQSSTHLNLFLLRGKFKFDIVCLREIEPKTFNRQIFPLKMEETETYSKK